MKRLVILSCLLVLWSGPSVDAQHAPGQEHRRPDIKTYLEHLDSSDRYKHQKPAEVIEALGLKPGMAVADIGSGSGYFTRRFVEAVTDKGLVYAIDVEPEMLAYVKDSLEHMHVPYTAEFILAAPDNPKLPPHSVDLIFLCNTYHHVDDRAAYFTRVTSALKPGGRVAIIDFWHDGRAGNVGFPKEHLVPRDRVVEEMSKAGYTLTREHDFLPRQYFLEFSPA